MRRARFDYNNYYPKSCGFTEFNLGCQFYDGSYIRGPVHCVVVVVIVVVVAVDVTVSGRNEKSINFIDFYDVGIAKTDTQRIIMYYHRAVYVPPGHLLLL